MHICTLKTHLTLTEQEALLQSRWQEFNKSQCLSENIKCRVLKLQREREITGTQIMQHHHRPNNSPICDKVCIKDKIMPLSDPL